MLWQQFFICYSYFFTCLSIYIFYNSFCLLRSYTWRSSSCFISRRFLSNSICQFKKNYLESKPRVWLRCSSSFNFYLSNIQQFIIFSPKRPLLTHSYILITLNTHNIKMKLNLLILLCATISLIQAHPCQQVGNSNLAKLSICQITAPPPQMRWTINVTLLQDYDWKGADDIQYVYLTADDQPIDQNCYQGQTIKAKYPKGTTIVVEQLCFSFKPLFTIGSKLYLILFSSQTSSSSQVIYLTYSGTGQWESQPVTDQHRELALVLAKKNLVQEQQ